MSRYSIFFIFFLSQLIITSPYSLVGRHGHTASYMDNKIYFLGGGTEKYILTNDFFYLDVSKPFNLDFTLPIVVINNNARQILTHENALSTVCGPNKDTIFLICQGFGASLTYSFIIINNKERILDEVVINGRWSSAVCNKNGSYIYTYGRAADNITTMAFIDTTTHQLTWNIVDSNVITDYFSSMTLLPDGRIVYIGGTKNNFSLLDFRNIYIYDTNDGTWRNMSTSGIEPSLRSSHTAVLTQDGLIIIYGGINSKLIPVLDQISVLDTKVDPFTWSIPNTNPAPISAPFVDHTATLVGNYMIIAFGFCSNTTHDRVFNDQIHMIDVSEKNNYKWVKNFTPNIEVDRSAIIGGISGGIAAVIIIISVSYLLYCRKKTVIYAPQATHAINC